MLPPAFLWAPAYSPRWRITCPNGRYCDCVGEAERAGFDLSRIEALGREKDLLAVKELKAIREKQAKA
jgi:hypothetical protein